MQSPPPALIVDRHLVGCMIGGKWTAVDHTFAPKVPHGMPLVEVGWNKLGAKADAKFVAEEANGGTWDDNVDHDGKVYLSGIDPSFPRRVQTLSNSNRTYVQVVQSLLRQRGLRSAKPRIKKLLKTDLDGDGTQEVIIEARSREDTAGVEQGFTKADYSMVLLRCIEGRTVRDRALRLLSIQRDEFLETTRIRAIVDIDGDGRMEIVTSGQGYEWQNAQLWSYRAGKVTKLLENGAGV